MGIFIFFTTSLRICKAGSAVQDIKRASAPFIFKLVNVSNKYSGSTFAISESKSILKELKDDISIFFSEKYFIIVLFTDSG